MFYLLNQKFAELSRKATFNRLHEIAVYKFNHLDMNSPRSDFDEVIEIIEELRVQSTSHAVNKPAAKPLTVVPSEEVKF